ncbi:MULTISPECIES: PQ-loop domain-containing transporter [Aminobacterium]|mgnify:CR=1 FL=1|uniref:PQ-loop domain-containing transporter n=1 Tax=Aminobacterium TaxID=81466 RepID=UPI0004664D63|nr:MULTISPECIES: PQ-loop domain-containing transporter [Aminobacterium]
MAGKIFEAIMIICFGMAWPAAIYKSWASRSTGGKSLSFLCIILIGYVAGILHVILDSEGFSWILVLYILNTLMVSIDTCLYFRNRRIERKLK